MTQDRIEREVRIAAPIERVWAVLTEPAHVGEWFGQGKPAEIDLRPGGVMVLDHGEHGTFPTTIVTVEAPNCFAYRWASAYPGDQATEENSTLVEVTLSTEDDGTVLRVVETGFAALTIPPARMNTASYESHTSGWAEVVQNLRKHAEQQAA